MSLALRLPLICCSRSAVIGGVRSSLTATQHLSRHFTTNSIQHGILSKAASQQLSAMGRSRGFFLANTLPRTSTRAYSEKKAVTEGNTTDAAQNAVPESDEFTLSDRAKAASQVNYSARLSKRTTSAPTGGWAEIKRLFSLASGEKRALAGAIALLVITSCISVVFPSSIGAILDSTSKPAGENLIFGMQPAVFYASLSGLFVVGAITNTGRITLLRIIGERLVARLRIDLYRKTVHQDAEFFDANRVGDLISRLSSDSNIVAKSLTQNVSDGLRSALSCIFSFAMMGYVSLKLTSITILILPPIALGSYYYGRKIRQLSRELQESIGTLTKVSEERLSNIRTAQSFAGESKEIKLYADKVREVFSIGKREAQAAGIYFGSTQLTGNLTVLGLLALGSQMVISGELTIGELTSFTMYTGYAGSSAYGLSSFYSELMKGVGAATRLFELVDRQPSIHSTKGLPVTAESARKTINFQNVAFAYPTRPALKIFRDLTFSIPPGSNVCIVGPSGGGKSTITSLLLRFYDVNAGSISIGDTDIRDMNLKALRRHIGVVSQEPALFSGTIADNIAYGVPNATKAEIASAARRANCSFISDFPLGMDTKVGNRGTQLSGGQKQRIAIARALIKNPSILILDEATSALDAESEAAVTETLAILMREHRTTISIAHRLSTIKRSDVVIVLNSSGGVAEHGKFADLYADRNSALSQLLKAKEELELDGDDSTMKESDVACLGKESAEEKMREEEFLEGEIDQEIRDEVEEQERVDRTARPL